MKTTWVEGSVEAVRRKLRGLIAVVGDAGATEHERAKAETLKGRLERRFREVGSPAGDWTDSAFRLGKWAKGVTKPESPTSPAGDWTSHAQLGKAVRRDYKRWLSE
jgi:hypothetical protein